MGGNQALVSSRGVKKGCLSGLECFCVSVCLLPELCVWPPTHVCICTILSHWPRLGPWAQPPAPCLLGPPAHLFANFEQTQEPLPLQHSGQPAGCLNEPGPPSLVPPSMACSLLHPQGWAALCQCPRSGLSPPLLNSFQCLNSFCLYV